MHIHPRESHRQFNSPRRVWPLKKTSMPLSFMTVTSCMYPIQLETQKELLFFLCCDETLVLMCTASKFYMRCNHSKMKLLTVLWFHTWIKPIIDGSRLLCKQGADSVAQSLSSFTHRYCCALSHAQWLINNISEMREVSKKASWAVSVLNWGHRGDPDRKLAVMSHATAQPPPETHPGQNHLQLRRRRGIHQGAGGVTGRLHADSGPPSVERNRFVTVAREIDPAARVPASTAEEPWCKRSAFLAQDCRCQSL